MWAGAGLEYNEPFEDMKPRPMVIKLISCLTQLSMKFIMLINVTMPTIVVIRMINTTSESLKAWKFFIFQHFSFHDQLKFHVRLR